MNRLQNRLDAYERLVKSQEKTIALLEMQLRNERLKNNSFRIIIIRYFIKFFYTFL